MIRPNKLPFVSAIILAAGLSVRMGCPKLLMPLGRSTILDTTVRNYLDSEVSEIIVVLGPKPERSAKLLSNYPVKIAVNYEHAKGMSSTIKAGLNTINSKARGIMLALADQPLVNAEIINQLLEVFRVNKSHIIMPVYKEKRGHPVIFSSIYMHELLMLDGDAGAREVIIRHQDNVSEVRVYCNGVIIDIDSQQDYQHIIQEFDWRRK